MANMIITDVYDYSTRNKYAPFYCVKYGNYSNMVNQINEKIQIELKRLEIMEEKTYGSKNKENKTKCNNTNKRK